MVGEASKTVLRTYRKFESEGVEYKVTEVYSDYFYTQRDVYKISTTETDYNKAKRAINLYFERLYNMTLWNKGYYLMKAKESMNAAMHPYFEFKYDEDEDVYLYTFIRLYDD